MKNVPYRTTQNFVAMQLWIKIRHTVYLVEAGGWGLGGYVNLDQSSWTNN